MAINIPTNITNSLDGYLMDAKNIKGTYVVVNDYSELANLPERTIIEGSLAYCKNNYSTFTKGFYQYNGTTWTIVNFPTNQATYDNLGSIKLGSNTQATQIVQMVSSTADRQYALQVNNEGRASVNVPWTDTTYTNESASEGGTNVTLVTTGEKYTWNSKQDELTAGSNIIITNNVISSSTNPTINGVAYREI